MKTSFPRLVLAVPALCLTLAHSSFAATLLELDFQTYNSGTADFTADAVRDPAVSSTLHMTGNATANPGAATNIDSENAALTTGYFQNSRTTSSDGTGALQSAGAGSAYNSYTGTTGIGTNTFSLLYQPTATSAHGDRNYFFSSSYTGSSTQAVSFMIDSDNRLRLQIGSGSNVVFNFKMTDAIAWDVNSWYFLSASFSPGDGGGVSIYWQEVGSETGTFESSNNVLAGASTPVRVITLGNNATNGTVATSAMNGKMAYFLWTNEYTNTLGEYDALYESIVAVPEPGSTALLLLGAVFFGVVIRRRLLSRARLAA